jgi:hypothetical protein
MVSSLTRIWQFSEPRLKSSCRCQFHPTAARNLGISVVSGVIILPGNDDIFPAPNMVEKHLAWKRRYPEDSVGVRGYVTCDPVLRPTPLMRWVGGSGPMSDLRANMELHIRAHTSSVPEGPSGVLASRESRPGRHTGNSLLN